MGFVRKDSNLAFLGLLVIANLYSSFGQESVTPSSDANVPATTAADPGKCAQDMIDWCKKQEFSMIGQSISLTSIFIDGKMFYLSCVTNGVNGTQCNKNNVPWFGCSTKNDPTFKGQPLSSSSDDPEVCQARDQILRTVGQNKFNSEIFESAMENFHKRMEAFQRFMSRMFGPGFPFRNDYSDYDDSDDSKRYRYNFDGRRSDDDGDNNGDDGEH